MISTVFFCQKQFTPLFFITPFLRPFQGFTSTFVRQSAPYDGDMTYWSERKSKLYDGHTSKAIKKQSHLCKACGLKFVGEEPIHLHHVDGNHSNWNKKNLVAIHESCHDYIHMNNGGNIVEIHEPCYSDFHTSKSAS